MRFAIGGIPAHRFAQPENRCRCILFRPVRVAKIEVVVRIVLIDLECLVEIIGRAPGFRRHRPPHLNDTDVVHARSPRRRDRRASAASQMRRPALELNERQARRRTAHARTSAMFRHGGCRDQRRLPVAFVVVDRPQRQPARSKPASSLDCGFEIADLRGVALAMSPLMYCSNTCSVRRPELARSDRLRRPARRLTRSKIANRLSSEPDSTTLALHPAAVEPDVLRPTAIWLPVSANEPITTCVAPTT